MRKTLTEKGIFFLVFLFFFLLTEAITFRWVGFATFPKFLYIDILIALLVGALTLLVRSDIFSFVIFTLVYAIVIALFLINVTMYGVYYDLFSLQQLQLVSEAAAVFNFEHLSVTGIITATILSLLFLAANILLLRKFRGQKPLVSHYFLKSLVIFASINILAITLFSSDIPSVLEYSGQVNITAFKRAYLEKYGTLGYYAKEAEDIVLREYKLTDDTEDPDVGGTLAEETDYFGLLEGKNVITIMIESGQPFAVNETLTPNLYKLTQEGLYFSNNYSENKTNVAEMSAITGNYPSINFLPSSYDYDFSFSMPNILNDTYSTMYFHDNVASFYSRGDLMPQLGFENIYLHDDLYPGQDIWSWSGDYTLDSATIDEILPTIIASEEPFYAFWTTLSMHGPYNYGSVNIAKFTAYGYFDRIDAAEAAGRWVNPLAGGDSEDVARLRHYEAAVMDFDKAIGKLLDALEDNDLLEDTVIVLYGDHNVYYHDLALKMYEDTGNDYYNMEMYHTFFCIYNETLTSTYLANTGASDTTIDTFTSPYCIVPTLLDLLGYHYEQDIYMGDSVFSDTMQVFYSHKLTGLFTNCLYSNDGEEIVYANQNITDEYLETFRERCQDVIGRLNYINSVYYNSQEPKEE